MADDETPDDPTPQKPKPKRVKIEVVMPDDITTGEYVNMARVFHNPTEFVLDGLFLPPQSTKAHVRSRVVMSPAHAKILHAALTQNLRVYEKKFGAIKVPNPGSGEPGPILH